MHVRLPLALTAAFLAAGAALSAPAEKAKCPVAGNAIEVNARTAKVFVQGKPQYLCCTNCVKEFTKAPEKYVKEVGACPLMAGHKATPESASRVAVNNGVWYVCCPGCLDGLAARALEEGLLEDVVSGKKFKGSDESPKSEYQGQAFYFESKTTKAAFDKEPAKYALVFSK